MNWYKKAQQQYLWENDPAIDYANVETEKEKWDLKYPRAGSVVGGLNVVGDVDNTESIGASLMDYYIYDGIRECLTSDFGEYIESYSASENRRVKQLAKDIEESGQISPLIVVVEEKGPYILAGSHRIDALQLLNLQSFVLFVYTY